jgi:hypothetical protein
VKLITKLWIGLFALIVLSPLGLIIPARFQAGSAWGEWGADEMAKLVGYVPKGLERLSGLWPAPMPDYAFKGWGEKGPAHLSFAYIISALLGTAIIFLGVLLIGKLLAKKGE